MTQSVWLHGAGLSAASWAGFEGLALDLPGHGSAPRVAPPTVEQFAEALIPSLPEVFHIVGHSLGGMVALEIVARLKERVRSLVTVEAVPTVRFNRRTIWTARAAMTLFRWLGPRLVARLSRLGQSRAAADHISPLIAAMDPYAMNDALQAAAAYDGRPRLAEVTAPALVLVGAKNRETHFGAQVMADARYESLPGGHILHVDCREALRGRIADFQREAS